MTRLRIPRAWVLGTLLYSFCHAGPLPAQTLHIGSIGISPADEIRDFLPLARYLSEVLKSVGIDDVKIVVAASIPEMATLMRAGKVDLHIDSAFPCMATSNLAGSKFLLRRWKRGIGEYRSVIFAKKENGIVKLADLKGRTIAFEEPFSSSGYFFPKLALVQAGLKPAGKREPSDAVAGGEVGYVFSNADENTMAWVLRDRVSAGATDHQQYVKHARTNLKDLVILQESAPIPRHILSYRQGLADKLVVKIKESLLAMNKTESGKETLLAFQRTTKFDPIPPEFNELVSRSAPFVRQELGLK